MPLAQPQLHDIISKAFPDADFTLEDLKGDQNHYELTISCASFVGKSRVQQHQMVYAALGNLMGNELHALALTTKTPISS